MQTISRLLVTVLSAVCGRLPDVWRVGLGTGLGMLLRLLRFRRRTAIQQLAAAFPDLDPRERTRLLRRFYRHLGLLTVEILALPAWSRDDVVAHCTFEGLEHIRAAHAKGRGVLVLAAHVGNWEVGLAHCASLGYQTCAIVKELRHEPGQEIATRVRHAHGVQAIPRRGDMRGIIRALKRGAAVGVVLDQNMTSDEGIFVEFFGRPACTMAALAVLAHKYAVPVVPVCFYREPDLRRHRTVFWPEIAWEARGQGTRDAIRHNTQRYTTAIERMIRAHPDQWLWMHRRWRTQPERAAGETAAADVSAA